MPKLTPKQKDLVALDQDLDQVWSHLHTDITSDPGKDVLLSQWADGIPVKLSCDDKATIRFFVQAGLMYVQCMTLRQQVMHETIGEGYWEGNGRLVPGSPTLPDQRTPPKPATRSLCIRPRAGSRRQLHG